MTPQVFLAATTIEVTGLINKAVEVDKTNKNYYFRGIIMVGVIIYLALFITLKYRAKADEENNFWLSLGYILAYVSASLFGELICTKFTKARSPNANEGNENQNS